MVGFLYICVSSVLQMATSWNGWCFVSPVGTVLYKFLFCIVFYFIFLVFYDILNVVHYMEGSGSYE